MNKNYFFGILLLLAFAGIFGLTGSASAQQYYTGLCAPHSYQQCTGNTLYWYDSCGNQQDSQYCSNGCYGNACQNYNNYNYNNNNACTFHAYELCQGNNIYWYDSCGTQQDFVQTCSGSNMVCKYGQCVYQAPYINPAPAPQYYAHYKISCYASNLYWYDSTGRATGLNKNCADTNTCTLDACGAGKCSNVLKCDGSTCAAGSPDYNTYCATMQQSVKSNLAVTFLAKENKTSTQWQKIVGAGSNGAVYFMISVADNSATPASNVNVSANIPSEISSLGNLQVNGVAVTGDIVAGISVGELSPGSAKSITFEGKTQAILTSSTKQATATVNSAASPQTDAISINFTPGQAIAGVSASQNSSGIWEFIKRWYLWILVGLVLIFLFIVVFRRLSSNT